MPVTTVRKTTARKTATPAKARKSGERSGFRCGSCGEWHEELATDIGCGLQSLAVSVSLTPSPVSMINVKCP